MDIHQEELLVTSVLNPDIPAGEGLWDRWKVRAPLQTWDEAEVEWNYGDVNVAQLCHHILKGQISLAMSIPLSSTSSVALCEVREQTLMK